MKENRNKYVMGAGLTIKCTFVNKCRRSPAKVSCLVVNNGRERVCNETKRPLRVTRKREWYQENDRRCLNGPGCEDETASHESVVWESWDWGSEVWQWMADEEVVNVLIFFWWRVFLDFVDGGGMSVAVVQCCVLLRRSGQRSSLFYWALGAIVVTEQCKGELK